MNNPDKKNEMKDKDELKNSKMEYLIILKKIIKIMTQKFYTQIKKLIMMKVKSLII